MEMNQANLKKLFLAFRDQCIWLRCCYNTYAALYESDVHTAGALKKTAEIFFRDLNAILIEYLMQQICNVTDRAEIAGRRNLTVERVNRVLAESNHLSDEIVHLSKELLRYRAFIVDARNKVIAHFDEDTALLGRPVGEHPSEEVGAFFENLQAYCDEVGNAVGEGPLDFRTSSGAGDVIDLIKKIKNPE